QHGWRPYPLIDNGQAEAEGAADSPLPGGHRHHHGAELAVSRQTTRAVLYVLVPCAVATVIAMIFLWPGQTPTAPSPTSSTQRAYGVVQGIQLAACPSGQASYGAATLPCGRALVRITDGPGKGQDAAVDLPQGPGAPRLADGDEVVLGVQPDVNGGTSQ